MKLAADFAHPDLQYEARFRGWLHKNEVKSGSIRVYLCNWRRILREIPNLEKLEDLRGELTRRRMHPSVLIAWGAYLKFLQDSGYPCPYPMIPSRLGRPLPREFVDPKRNIPPNVIEILEHYYRIGIPIEDILDLRWSHEILPGIYQKPGVNKYSIPNVAFAPTEAEKNIIRAFSGSDLESPMFPTQPGGDTPMSIQFLRANWPQFKEPVPSILSLR